MAIEFDGKGNIVSTTEDGVIAVKLYSMQKQIDEKDKEIERLKEENNFLKLNNPQMNLEHFRVVKENKIKIDNLRRVNKRLNNIINELEKWLKEKQILYGINQQGFSWGVCGEALDKLQELKGDDSNEL